jgi:hypothetical protein
MVSVNEHLRFNGKLISAGIFPEIEEALVLQDDYSLGIRHSVAEKGLPVYGGKGTYYFDLQLDKSGLRGSGKLDYLASVLYSDDFLFLPDSMNTVTNDFLISKQSAGTPFPGVRSRNNPVQWLPSENLMNVLQRDRNFDIFNGQADLNGSLQITPSGLTGKGTLEVANAVFSSGKYNFYAESLEAEKSSFAFRNPGNPLNALSAGEIRAFVDLESRKGEFSRDHGTGSISMPLFGYIADPENIVWKIDEHKFELFSSGINSITGRHGAEYISMKKGQDSLRFFSPLAIMDYSSNILQAGEVAYLEIADATIFPVDETIIIRENAEMMPLENARLIAGSSDTHLHEIYDATLKIMGRNEYNGTGSYDYVDEKNEIQRIHFDKISVSRQGETYATGKIEEQDNFLLSPAFRYYGETELRSTRPHLNLRGSARTTHNCKPLAGKGLAFEHIIDPMDIMIPVPAQAVSSDRQRVYSGIFISTDSVHIYPAFFSERKNYSDQLIVKADGYIKFDQASGEYRIASMEKLRDPVAAGNILTLNTRECILRGQGELELGVTFGQLKINAAGSAQNELELNKTTIEGLISLDFPFAENALALIGSDTESNSGQPVDSLANYYGGPEGLAGYQLAGQVRSSFVLFNVKLEWDREKRSYVSIGKIGLAYVNGREINKMFNGYLEITKRRSGDLMDFYIEMDDSQWYYFGYTRGVMQAFSSNRSFVGKIEETALRHRRDRGSTRDERYVYMLASDAKLDEFFRNYRRHLETIDSQITLIGPSKEDEPGLHEEAPDDGI